jgi:hypothetical protein
MANIPTAQIPNVQAAVGNSPMASASAVRVPNIQRMPVLGREVFDGVGAGMVGLSRGVWEGAQMLDQFSQKMSQANDNFQFAAADRTFSEAVANHEVEAATLPPDKHLELWESKYLPKVQSSISGMRVTPDGRARLDAYMQRQTGSAYAAIKTGAYKQFLTQGLQESDNYIDRAMQEGRPEDAFAQLARDEQANVRSPQEAEARRLKIEEDTKVATMTQAIQQNPAQWRGELAKYQKEGKNPYKLRPEQVLQFRRMAEGVHGQLVQDVGNELLNQLETNSAGWSNDQIETFLTRPDLDFPRELINRFKETRDFKYADTPEGQAEQATRFSDLWQKIFSYDAEKDISMADPDTHKREYQRLISEIVTTAPEGQRKPFMDTLDGMVSQANQGQKSRTDEITRNLINQTSKLAEWGQFGDAGKWKKEERGDVTVTKPQDVNAWLNVQTKREKAINEIRSMMRENPDLTIEQAQERFKGIVEPYLDPAASFMNKPEEEDGWWKSIMDVATWADFAMNPTANNPNVMTAGLGFRGFGGSLADGFQDADQPLPPVQSMPPTPEAEVAASGKRVPASIRNNNAGAMWPAKWQSKFGGEHGENLADGKGNKIARFPTKVHGAAATMYLLGNEKLIYNDKNVRDGIKTWSNASGSSLRAYIDAFEKAGFSADERIGDIMTDPERAIAFTKAMSKFEAGREFPMTDEEWAAAFAMFSQA